MTRHPDTWLFACAVWVCILPEVPLVTACGTVTTTDAPLCLWGAQVEGVGRYFRGQLLQSRHRGAFELAYVGFVRLTDVLCR